MNVSQRDKRLLMILAGVAAVAAVLFVLLLRGGGSKALVAGAPSGSVNLGKNEAQPASKRPANAPKTLVFSGRDPFEVLVSLPTVTDTSGTTASTSTSTSTVSPATSPAPAPADGSSVTIGGHSVVLDDVFTGSGHTKVQVEVDGAVYTVNVGGTFATSFKLVSVSGSTANFLYGDQPFTLTAPNPSGS